MTILWKLTALVGVAGGAEKAAQQQGVPTSCHGWASRSFQEKAEQGPEAGAGPQTLSSPTVPPSGYLETKRGSSEGRWFPRAKRGWQVGVFPCWGIALSPGDQCTCVVTLGLGGHGSLEEKTEQQP